MTGGAVSVLERLRICGIRPTIGWEFEDLAREISLADLLANDTAAGTYKLVQAIDN